MNAIAKNLVPRLIFVQLVVGFVTGLVIVAFAPPLLLIDSSVIAESAIGATWAAFSMVAYVIGGSWIATRHARPALRALAAGSDEIEGNGVAALYALPARLVVLDVVGAFVLALATLISPLRPASNDLTTQVALVLLTMTMFSVALLLLYVMMRVSVGRVLELVPTAAARDAVETMARRGAGRMRPRLLLAVAAPVTFVALASSMLAYGHARAIDTAARDADAAALAQGMMDRIGGDATGVKEAIAAAAARGFVVDVLPTSEAAAVKHDENGNAEVIVPLEEGHARVRAGATRIGPIVGVYVILTIIATALAGLLGARIGAAFAADVSLATREIRAAGVADFLTGTRMLRRARFSAIATLLHAIEELGGVFREFASAQQRSIEARAANERMRGLLLASMSHDLKSPLNAILGFAELVLRSPLGDAQRESLSIIEQRGRELLMLIETILDSARVEAGELGIEPEWTMVGDVVMSAVLDARDLSVGTNVQVVGEIQPGVPKLYVDPSRIIQALIAVIMTAVRFSDGGIVYVRATLPSRADRLRIDVETSGRGIPAIEREKIFEAFKYADRARRMGSLGLGLSLARSILEIHRGTIEIDVTEKGGAVFHVWLPVSNDGSPPALSSARVIS